MINNFIREGYVEKRSNKSSDANTGKVGFHLERWLKKALTFLNVPFYDKCCDTTTVKPVRYNVTLTRLEYFDGTSWIDITTL